MKLLALLGSGVSYASYQQPPTVAWITERLFDQAWYRHTDSNFYPKRDSQEQPHYEVKRVQQFLRVLREMADPYLEKRGRHRSNYEDLFFLARQIEDELRGTTHNAGIADFLTRIREATREFCVPQKPLEDEFTLSQLASRSCDFIECVVWHLLATKNSPVGLELLLSLAKQEELTHFDIGTLNHDLLPERLFSDAGIPFRDGFGDWDGDVRWFNPVTLDDETAHLRLFKLHGSLNWRWMERVRGDRSTFRYAIPSDSKILYECCDSKGMRLLEVNARPRFLTGTQNKFVEYRFGIFAEIHSRFLRALNHHQRIVMSGYGCGDLGINGWISEWLWASRENRLVILHRNIEELRSPWGVLNMRYGELIESGQLVVIPKWLSEVSLEEVISALR